MTGFAQILKGFPVLRGTVRKAERGEASNDWHTAPGKEHVTLPCKRSETVLSVMNNVEGTFNPDVTFSKNLIQDTILSSFILLWRDAALGVLIFGYTAAAIRR